MPTAVLVGLVIAMALVTVAASAVVFVVLRRSAASEATAAGALGLDTTYAELAELRAQALADAAETRRRAQEQADLVEDARRAHDTEVQVLKGELRELRSDLERREHRLADREARIDAEQREVELRERDLGKLESEVTRRRAELEDVAEERRLILERTAGLTAEAAKAELIATMQNQAKREAAIVVRDIERAATEDGDRRARNIVTLAIQRVASEQTAESVVSVLHLPSDDMKGRIIGREGRNIRAFETVTGVNLIIDDTPEAVLLSCFDPVRREVGRITLEKLVLDGRIHPHRIEEIYERSVAEVEQLCARAGEDALVEVGITSIHPELVALLGQLRYRTSYGQNVLKHLIESAHLAGIMASELRPRPSTPQTVCAAARHRQSADARGAGQPRNHRRRGRSQVRRERRRRARDRGAPQRGRGPHDRGGARPKPPTRSAAAGPARGGSRLESYVQRLERLEEIATSYEGVEKVFAMQAGREVRVMVLPDQVDDIQAQVIARDIAKQIEEELTYPGQIRVTVVRESRATELAH